MTAVQLMTALRKTKAMLLQGTYRDLSIVQGNYELLALQISQHH